MLDVDTGKAMCVVDLDPIMPGSPLCDFGDMMHTTTNEPADSRGLRDAEGYLQHAGARAAAAALCSRRFFAASDGRRRAVLHSALRIPI